MDDKMLSWLQDRTQALAETPEELRIVRDDLHGILAVTSIHHDAAGVLVRKVTERLVRNIHQAELGDPKSKPLCDMIESLREKGRLTPRIASYFHTIRRIGDDAAHHEISPEDLMAVFLPLLLVLEWYFCAYANGPKCPSIYSSSSAPPLISEPGAQTAMEHANLIERLIRLTEQSPHDFDLQLWVEKEGAARSVRDFSPDVVPGTPHICLGDRAIIGARADQDCYLWIVNVGTTGRTAILFPRREGDDNAVTAGEVVHISGTFARKTGLETFHAFASKSPLNFDSRTGSTPAERTVRDFLADEETALRKSASKTCASRTLQFAIDDKPEGAG